MLVNRIVLDTNVTIASNVIQVILNSPFVEFIDTYFHFHLIEQD